MSTLLSEKKEGQESQKLEAKSNAQPIMAAFAFLLGLLPCLFHNLSFCESRIMLATDGKHFLHTVGLLVEYFKQAGDGALTQKFLTESQIAGHIIFDGPLMSLIYSPLFLLLNKIPNPRDWMTLAIGQSIFHALSTMLLTLLVAHLTRSRFFAIMAALIYGLYPPAVLQSGHFMSELPVTSLLLLLFLCLTSGLAPDVVAASEHGKKQTGLVGGSQKQIFAFITAGICAGLLVLSKPALIPCVALLSAFGLLSFTERSQFAPVLACLFTFKPGLLSLNAQLMSGLSAMIRQIAKPSICLLAGLLTVLVSWSVFCFQSTGNVFPTAQRQPLYNVVSGWNFEAGGWAHNPHPPLTEIYSDADGPLATAAGIWISHPQPSFRLALSKISRLISCPWNDFKGRALGLDENAQILIHRLIIACAAFGASIFLFCSRRYLDKRQTCIVQMAALLVVCHLSYLMVECQPRYTFTAMPLLVLLAVYGFWQASRLSFQDTGRRLTIAASVAMALGLTALLLHAENLCLLFDARAFRERTHVLARQDSVEKLIDLSALKVPAKIKSALLLVDGDKSIEKCNIEVNGVLLKDSLRSTMHFDAQHYLLYDQLREFGPSMRISVDDFRQWRAVPIDARLINWHGNNRIVLKSLSKEATIYGDGKKSRYVFSPDYCNYGVLAGAPYAAGAESRYTDPVLAAATKEASAKKLKGGARHFLKDSLRLRFLVNLGEPSAATPPAAETSSIHVDRSQFDQMLWDNNSSDCLQINKVVLYAARTVAANIPLSNVSQTGTHLNLRIKGELKALKNAGDVGLLCAIKGANGTVQVLGKTPRALVAGNEWNRFQIDDLVPLSMLGGKAQTIELALYPCPWMEGQYGVSRRATDALFRNIVIETSGKNLPEISSRRIIY